MLHNHLFGTVVRSQLQHIGIICAFPYHRHRQKVGMQNVGLIDTLWSEKGTPASFFLYNKSHSWYY
jgi:hypothetical protein